MIPKRQHCLTNLQKQVRGIVPLKHFVAIRRKKVKKNNITLGALRFHLMRIEFSKLTIVSVTTMNRVACRLEAFRFRKNFT